MPLFQWIALISVSIATTVTIRIWERGRWNIGLIVRPRVALREFALGCGLALTLIAGCDALILLTTKLREARGDGLPLLDLIAVFVPAALHEELAFRGYVFQKIRRWNRIAAIVVSATVFAVLHANNIGVSPLAIANILLAGVFLALAYERFERLWFPIGIHFAWNVISGPLLGFPVSGLIPRHSLLRVTGSGSALVTGGAFGMEGSIWMGVVEVAGILWLMNELRISNFGSLSERHSHR